MKSLQQHYLGWQKPFIKECAKWLFENKLQLGELTKSSRKVIVPSSSAVRQLRSNLLHIVSQQELAVAMPIIQTPYQFVASSVSSSISVADERVMVLLITEQLKQLDSASLEILIGQQQTSDFLKLSEQIIQTLSLCTLAGVNIDPKSWNDSAQLLLTQHATERLLILSSIIQNVSMILEQRGFTLEHDAFMQAMTLIDREDENCLTIAGVTDLQPLVVSGIQSIAEQGAAVDVLIRAPESCKDGFTLLGTVVESYWEKKSIDIPETSIHVAGAPSHQAVALLKSINSEGGIPIDQIMVSATDESVIPILQHHFKDFSFQTRIASGLDAKQSLPFQLIQSLTEFISTRSVQAFASLIRHPDLIDRIKISEGAIGLFDDWCMQYLPETLNDSSLHAMIKDREKFQSACELYEQLIEFIENHGLFGEVISTIESLNSVRSIIVEIYGDVTIRQESPLLTVFNTIFDTLNVIENAFELLDGAIPQMSCTQVMQQILRKLRTTSIPEYPNADALEFSGWLEAMITDDPYLFIVGMSSESLHSDRINAFLPNQVKHAIGIDSVELRFARDAHAVQAMQASRKAEGAIHWIVSRKDIDGSPLTPSPLLLRCNSADVLANRALRVASSLDHEVPVMPRSLRHPKEGEGIPLPLPTDIGYKRPTKINVTAFRDYLSCPYRYWLKHILRLSEVSNIVPELDHREFGTMFHLVLQKYCAAEERLSWDDPSQIESYLNDEFKKQLWMRFGNEKQSSGLIRLQKEIARTRITEFAKHQSKEVQQGWQIIASELSASFVSIVDGEEISVHGKIDRIEKNENGILRVLDYKTGSSDPTKTHIKHGEWVDLQLPLYRRLLNEMPDIEESVANASKIQLGYFNISSKESSSGIKELKIKDELEQLINPTIQHCIEGIARCHFGEGPSSPAPKYTEQYSWICQDTNAFSDEGLSGYE